MVDAQFVLQGQGDLGVCADTFDYYAEMAPQIMKTSHPSTGTAKFYSRQRCFGNFEKISVLTFVWCHFLVVLPVVTCLHRGFGVE